MATSYYANPISPNVWETEDGYRICRNAVIARTGYQTYRVGDLNQYIRDRLVALGLDTLGENDTIEFYRPESEVFHPNFVRSLESTPLTDEHPPEMLTPETHTEFQRGHVRDVKRGKEPLDSGDLALAADIILTDAEVLTKHDNGRRELSCGYTYDVRKVGNRIEQCELIANHVALVPKGRAGHEVGIKDSAPLDAPQERKMAKTLKQTIGAAWKAWMGEASDEDVADAVGGEGSLVKGLAKHIGLANDADDEHPKGCRCADCKGGADSKGKGKDADKDDKDDKGEADDAAAAAESAKAMDALKDAGKGDDADDDDDDKGESDDADDEDDEDDDDKDDKKGKAKDDDTVTKVVPLDAADLPKPGVGTANDTALALNVLRPFIARSKDKKLRAAFDSVAKLTNDRTPVRREGGSSYGKFSQAAQRRDKGVGADRSDKTPDQVSVEAATKAYEGLKGKM